MILGSPGGSLSFIGPFLIARNTGPEPSGAGETRQSMYTSVRVAPSSTATNPSLIPPSTLSTLRGTGSGRLAPWQRLFPHWKSKDSNRAVSMLPGSFTVPRLTPSSSSLAGTMPPFAGEARGGLAASLALKQGSFSRFFFQLQHAAAANLPTPACNCCAVDEQETLDRRVSNICLTELQLRIHALEEGASAVYYSFVTREGENG